MGTIIEDSNEKGFSQDPPKSLWVFGYGSILWQTGFDYNTKEIGYIRGYKRVFWQGNATHRGTVEQPGRVATLVPNKEGVVWGAAYHLTDPAMIEHALSHLNSRECTLGGYGTTHVTFHPRDCPQGHSRNVLVFLAFPGNTFYLGPDSAKRQAQQIVSCSGSNGTNTEYVLFLAWFLRRYIPEYSDPILDELEIAVLDEIEERSLQKNDLIRTKIQPQNLVFEQCDECQNSSTVKPNNQLTPKKKLNTRVNAV